MKKHTSEEAYYERIRNLAAVNKSSVSESKNRSLGTLIDFVRAADGVAYGIIKEQHKYYIKKGGLNENQDVADFAYIGGVQNVTDFQYNKLAEAEKNRNFLLATINEGVTTKVNPSGSKNVAKKGILTEDKASQEIEMAASKVDDLDAATAAAEVPAEVPADDGAAEMEAGLDSIPADGGEEMPVDGDMPADDMGADPLAGGEEMPVDGGDPLAGDEEMPVDDAEGGEEVAVEDPESEATREIEKTLGKLTNTLRKTELTEPQVKSYVNSFLSAFKDDFPEIDIEDRKAMAEKITKVVPDSDIEDLGQSIEDEEAMEDPMAAAEPEEEIAEEQCAECGGFAQYAESRGYGADTIGECGEEEMTNLVSGYANAHGEGQNDGDFKAVALFITPEIIEKLKGEYGHDEFANQVEPFSTEMNETSIEDKQAQINELFGGLKNLGKAAGQGIKQGAQKVGQAVADKASQVSQAVGQAATNVKQTYHAGELGGEVKKLEKAAANLGAQIGSLNNRMQKAGGQPINVGSILTTIKNQVAAGGTANLGKFSSVQEDEGGIPVDSVEVQPMMEDAAIEEDVTITVNDKKGKPLSPKNVPTKEMKEGEEPEGDVIDDIDDAIGGEEGAEGNVSPDGEEEVLDLTKREEPEMDVHAGFESMGGGVVKPEGAEMTTVEVIKDSVNVTLSESETKLRKYIRNRLEEHAGIKKPSLNENKKSEKLQKLDRIIDKQFNLFEADVKKRVNENINEILGMSIGEKLAKINPQDPAAVDALFQQAFKNILINPKMGAIGRAAKSTPPEVKFDILQQYVKGNGGSLRLADINTVQYVPQDVKNAATHSKFQHGGTQGKTGLGGV